MSLLSSMFSACDVAIPAWKWSPVVEARDMGKNPLRACSVGQCGIPVSHGGAEDDAGLPGAGGRLESTLSECREDVPLQTAFMFLTCIVTVHLQ